MRAQLTASSFVFNSGRGRGRGCRRRNDRHIDCCCIADDSSAVRIPRCGLCQCHSCQRIVELVVRRHRRRRRGQSLRGSHWHWPGQRAPHRVKCIPHMESKRTTRARLAFTRRIMVQRSARLHAGHLYCAQGNTLQRAGQDASKPLPSQKTQREKLDGARKATCPLLRAPSWFLNQV